MPNSAFLRLRRPRRSRSRHVWLWLLPGVAAMIALSLLIGRVRGDYQFMREQASNKNAQLTALRAQLDANQKRLDALGGPRGREIILRERGYIRPGERILLFPPDK